ncbi:hypothetical protein QR680_011478 [Steinernema hermaphroditum]|uniref:F-box domain-containing protein n=1 Tax=Steinernema hermaphroditum TaxID=289476 RepID=A0AA39LYS0_9BILA|nr:hypothetical protein QR680_011478 [Steinernema hermaphroditum]
MFRLFLNNFTLYVFQSFFTVAMLNDLPVNSIKKVSLPIVEEYMEPLVLAVAELPNLRELDIKCWAKLPSSSVVAALENLLLRDQLSFFDVSEDVKFSASFFEEFLTKRLGSKKWSLNHLHINYNVCDLHKDFQRPRSPGNTAWSLTWEHDMGTINVNCPSTKKKKKCTIC